jgi:hypothetical protein
MLMPLSASRAAALLFEETPGGIADKAAMSRR